MAEFIVIIGYLVLLAAYIWVTVIAFKESVGQGLMCLFLGIYVPFYIRRQWPDTQNPFYLGLAGIAFLFLAGIV